MLRELPKRSDGVERILVWFCVLWLLGNMTVVMLITMRWSIFGGSPQANLPPAQEVPSSPGALASMETWSSPETLASPETWSPLLRLAVALWPIVSILCFLIAASVLRSRGMEALSGYRRLTAGLDPLKQVEGRADRVEVAVESRWPFLEVLFFFLVGVWLLPSLAMAWVGAQEHLLWVALAVQWLLLLIPASLWWRGLTTDRIRRGLGWTLDGWPREVASGLYAYLASMPILAVGLMLSGLVSKALEAPAYHPIVDQLSDSSGPRLWLIWATATIWAPLLEETVFRGALYHYLRARTGVGLASLIGAVAFAGLHPQGPAGWPFLISLGFVLALTREWRGSIVACMTIHFVHNAILLTLLTSLVR